MTEGRGLLVLLVGLNALLSAWVLSSNRGKNMWLVFCAGDCPFDPKPIISPADACGEGTGCHTCHQEVGRCSTRGASQGMYITFASAKVNKAKFFLKKVIIGDQQYFDDFFLGVRGSKKL